MKEFLDPDEFPALTNGLKLAEEKHLKAQYQFKQDIGKNAISVCGLEDEANAVYQHILKNYGRIKDLRVLLEDYLKQYNENVAAGKSGINSLDVTLAAFGTLLANLGSNNKVDYSQYPHAQEYLKREKTFTEEYEEAYAYFSSDEYLEFMRKYLGPSEYANYKLLFDGLHDALFSGFDHEYKLDEYTDALMASALRGILESIPDNTPQFKSTDDMYAYFDKKTGLSGSKKFISAVKQYLSHASSAGEAVKLNNISPDLLKDPAFIEFIGKEGLLEFLDKDVYGASADLLTWMGKISKGVGTAVDVAEGFDLLVESALILSANYDAQVEYLNVIKESLSTVGMYQGNVKKVMDQCLDLYSDQEAMVIDKVSEYIVGKANGELTKAAIDQFNGYLPGLKMANIILNTVDKTYDFVFADKISAVKSVSGCLQYDKALSATYDHYIDMMKAGVATDEDMKKAEVIYEILIATKKKEQEAITLMKKSAK